MIKILLIGSNPSHKSPDNTPFHASTRSRIILDAWFRDIECQMSFMNVSDQKTDNNKPLTRRQIRNYIPHIKQRLNETDCHGIVALGQTASWALTQAEVPHLAMPHPSGMNRQLNDPEFVAGKIEELRKFIDERREDQRISREHPQEVQE